MLGDPHRLDWKVSISREIWNGTCPCDVATEHLASALLLQDGEFPMKPQETNRVLCSNCGFTLSTGPLSRPIARAGPTQRFQLGSNRGDVHVCLAGEEEGAGEV